MSAATQFCRLTIQYKAKNCINNKINVSLREPEVYQWKYEASAQNK